MRPPEPPRLRLAEAVALGVLHGPAELLPISSSAHTELVPWLLRWDFARLDAELRKSFAVALHAGTALALLVGLREEAARLPDRREVVLLAGSLGPPAVAGALLAGPVARRLGRPGPIAAGLAAGSAAMAWADRRGATDRRRADATPADALALGVAQACALVPGVSRSGATLAAARLRGFAPADAQALSLQAALPVIAGATALESARLARRGLPRGGGASLAAGAAASFAATLASIRLARGARRLGPWAAYRTGLAAVVVARLARERRPHGVGALWQHAGR